MANVPSIPRIPSIPSVGGVGGGVPYALQTLTFTGGLITDAVRAAGVEGDGLTPPAGVGIWPAATNLVTNGGAETGTTGWTQTGSANIFSRSTTRAKFGSASFRLLRDATAGILGMQTANIAVTGGATYTVSGFFNSQVGTVGNIAIKIREITGGTAAVQTTGTTLTTDEWGRLSASLTMGASVTAARVEIVFNSGSDGDDVFVDGIQFETGSIATPYIETDGGTASRTAGRIQLPVDGLFTETQGAVFARFTPDWSALPNSNPMVISWWDAVSNRLECYVATTTTLAMIRQAAGSGASDSGTMTAVAQGTPVSGAWAWTATNLGVSANGAAFGTRTANSSIPTLAATSADLGSRAGSSVYIDSNVLWFATFAGTLTDADATALDAFGDTPPTPSMLVNACLPAADPTSLWACVDNVFQRIW